MLRQPGLGAGRMQQQQSRQAAGALFKGRQVQRALRQRLIGARQQENPVGLAQALMRPGAVGQIAAIEHHVMGGFEIVEPVGALLGGHDIQHRSARSHFAQRTGEAMGDGGGFQAGLQRHDGKGLGAGIVAAAARGVAQPLGHLLHQIHHHARMARDQLLERLRPDAQQFGIAQRHQLGGMFLAAHDEGHFAHRLAGWRQRHHAALALRVRHEDAEAAGDNQEQSRVILTIAVQQSAARQPEPV